MSLFYTYMIICGDKKIDLSSLRKTFADWSRAVRRSDDLMRAPHVIRVVSREHRAAILRNS